MKNKITDVNRKSLHDYGWLVIFFAILDLIQNVLDGLLVLIEKDAFVEEMNKQLAKYPEITESMLKIGVSVIVAIAAIMILIQVLLGVKAIKLSKNPTTAKWHITLAKVIGVFCAIATVVSIYDLFRSTDIITDILNAVVLAVDTFVMFAYANSAKKVRAQALGVAE